MKNFFNQIPRLWKGVYLIWFSLHFILSILQMDFFRLKSNFYPLISYYDASKGESGTYMDIFNSRFYDYSEFLIYTFVPILIALIIYYLKPTKDKDVK